MKHSLKLLAISAFVLLMATPAIAQSPEVGTLVLTERTEVSGTILEPGTYLIRVVAPQADRNKVQITSADRETIYVTALTIPHALEPGEKIPDTTFVFFPSGEGQPRALRTWFSTNPVTGAHDFVYDESRARQLARLANAPVVTVREEQIAVIEPEPLPMPEPVPAPAPVQTTEVTTTTTTTTIPAPEPAPVTTIETDNEPMASSAPEETAPEMPQTASRIPLLALLGMLSLAGALVVRFARA